LHALCRFSACTNDTYFLVIVPNRRIVIAPYTMTMNGQAFSSSHRLLNLRDGERHDDACSREQARSRKSMGEEREDGCGSCRRLRELANLRSRRRARPASEAAHTTAMPERTTMQTQQLATDRVFHALGDATRRAILEKLSQGPVLGVHAGRARWT